MKLIYSAAILGLVSSAVLPFQKTYVKTVLSDEQPKLLDSLVARVRRSPRYESYQINYKCEVRCENDDCEIECTKNNYPIPFKETGVQVSVPQEMRLVDAYYGDVIQEGAGLRDASDCGGEC